MSVRAISLGLLALALSLSVQGAMLAAPLTALSLALIVHSCEEHPPDRQQRRRVNRPFPRGRVERVGELLAPVLRCSQPRLEMAELLCGGNPGE